LNYTPEATRHANYDVDTATSVVWANGHAVCRCLFSFLFSLPTSSPIWTNEDLKRVVPRKEVPFGGLNDVLQNIGGKTTQKLKFRGRE